MISLFLAFWQASGWKRCKEPKVQCENSKHTTYYSIFRFSCISHTQKPTNNRKNMNNLNNASRLPANESTPAAPLLATLQSLQRPEKILNCFIKCRSCSNCVRQKWQTLQIERKKMKIKIKSEEMQQQIEMKTFCWNCWRRHCLPAGSKC